VGFWIPCRSDALPLGYAKSLEFAILTVKFHGSILALQEIKVGALDWLTKKPDYGAKPCFRR